MDVTAFVPGLAVHVEGTTDAKGTVDAKLVKFRPDAFAIAVAQEKQILGNRAAAGHAQTTADEAVKNAAAAQASADQAQSTANQGVAMAQAAGALAAENTVAAQMLN